VDPCTGVGELTVLPASWCQHSKATSMWCHVASALRDSEDQPGHSEQSWRAGSAGYRPNLEGLAQEIELEHQVRYPLEAADVYPQRVGLPRRDLLADDSCWWRLTHVRES
jgi:hypothetical protein